MSLAQSINIAQIINYLFLIIIINNRSNSSLISFQHYVHKPPQRGPCVGCGRPTGTRFSADDDASESSNESHHIADLDAFCLDHFPDTYRQIGPGFLRTERINTLLAREGQEKVWQCRS